jgi:hypothetical protein
VPPAEDGSLCPHCGWDAQDYTDRKPCGHLVFELTEWPENLAGIERGAFVKGADEPLGDLLDAMIALVCSWRGDRKRIRSLSPEHLRPLARAVADERPWEDPGPDVHAECREAIATDVFQGYLAAVFGLADRQGRRTSFDTEGRWGTWPDLFWSADPEKTAKRIRRQIVADIGAVNQQTRPSSAPGRTVPEPS